ncbi:MAG: prolyl-tRNA synthetase associated domain-containing protein [Candidatus Eremiobacteraeota bacterium]|nr:prolyl-tRNA synthetase associated domain-containing protein [Candidatus Eremiobacteraeota bacterium]
MEQEAQKVIAALESLGIAFTLHEHPPVYTVEEAEKHWSSLTGAHLKNLFLRNKKGSHHYLVTVLSAKSPDMKTLTAALGEDRLSFGSPERLLNCLGLMPGAVSPFGLINDHARAVKVVLDEDLKKEATVNFHPNVNTATVGLSFNDFEKFIAWCGNEVVYLPIGSGK